MDFISVERKSKQRNRKRNSLSEYIREEIRWQCMLVASGLKVAWLVDKIAVNGADELCGWCEEIIREECSIIQAMLREYTGNDASVHQQKQRQHQHQRDTVLVILQIGSDFFIMRSDVLLSKFRYSGAIPKGFLVIDINTDTPFVFNDTEKGSCTSTCVLGRHEMLCSAFDFVEDSLLGANRENVRVIRVPESNYATLVDSFGLPFLAGFLLEYPCVYYYTSNHDNALSMVPLVRVECQVSSVSSKEVALINVLEFSVPQCFENDELYKAAFASKMASMQYILDNNELIRSQVSSRITCQRSVNTLSRVAL